MRAIFNFTLILLLAILANNAVSQNRINPNFKYKIKGEKSEYNARDDFSGKKKIGVEISNIKNSYGTNRYPEYVEDHGGGIYSKDDYIQVFKIFKASIDPLIYKKLLNTNDLIAIYIVYNPGGIPYEVRFILCGDTLEKIPMDCFNNIEEVIKRSHSVQALKKVNDRYMQLKYEFRFNDLDSRQFDGEKVQLSKLCQSENSR